MGHFNRNQIYIGIPNTPIVNAIATNFEQEIREVKKAIQESRGFK